MLPDWHFPHIVYFAILYILYKKNILYRHLKRVCSKIKLDKIKMWIVVIVLLVGTGQILSTLKPYYIIN